MKAVEAIMDEMGYEGPLEEFQEMVENEDGSVDIYEPESPPRGFQDNLAESMEPHRLKGIAIELIELIELDRESREKRDEQYAEGLRRTGLGDDSPGGADFPGASRVVHPVLAEACVDYSSAMMKEIFPPDGPVKTHSTVSSSDPLLLERAENKRDFLNWQLTEQMPEYRANLEILSTQQPLGGSQFIKLIYDPGRRRPICEFIPIDRVFLPFSASSFDSSERATLAIPMTSYELDRRVRSGLYRDTGSYAPAFIEGETDSQQANDKIEGKAPDGFNEDGLRDIYEVYLYYELEEDGEGENPYIIHIDSYHQEVLAIYRNWEEEDELKQKLEWVVEWPFIPWRGAYGIGLAHLIGGLSASATGALRALLDSAHINNFPGGIRLKGSGRGSGQSLSINPTELVEIENVVGVDDIRKTVMGLPFNPPSATLFQLLGFVVDAAKGVISVADEKIGDSTNQMPVGTALALIEQGSKVFSAIHARQHVAQAKVLRILCRLNAQNFDEQAQVKQFGKVIVPREDFLTSSNISPVSDPNIFSEAQRYAQIQGVLQLSQDPTVPWNKVAIYRRVLRIMHIENSEEFLPDLPQPVSADPVTEIVAAMNGQQLKAVPGMPHLDHIQEELRFLSDPIFGAANPSNMSPGFQVILADIHQHMIFLFQQLKVSAAQQAQGQAAQLLSQSGLQYGFSPDEVPQWVEMQMATPQLQEMIKQATVEAYNQQVGRLQPMVQQLQQVTELVTKQTPKPPVPPEIQIQQQAMQAEIERKARYDEARLQMEGSRLQGNQQLEVARLQLSRGDQQASQAMDQVRLRMEMEMANFERRMSEMDHRVEAIIRQRTVETNLQNNREDNQQHQQTELMKNSDDNRTQLMIEEMRQGGLETRHQLTEMMREQSDRMDRLLKLIEIKTEERLRMEQSQPDQPEDKEVKTKP